MDSSNHVHHNHGYLNFTPSILMGFPPPISSPLNESSVIDKAELDNNKKEIIHAYGCLELFADSSNVEELEYGNVVLYRLKAVHDVSDNDEENEEGNSKINVYPSEGIISSFHRSSFVCIHLSHVHGITHETVHSERRIIVVQQLCLPGYEVLSLKNSSDGFNELWKRYESSSKSFFISCSIDNQISSRVLHFFDVSHRRLSFSGSELMSLNSFGDDSFSSGSVSSSNKDRKSPQTSKRHLGEKRSFPSSLEVIDEEEAENKKGNVDGDESNKDEDNGEDDDSKSKDVGEKSIDLIVRSSLTGEKRRVVLNGVNEETTVRALYEKVADDMDFDGESFVILLSGVTLDEEWKVNDIHLKDNDCLDIVIDENNNNVDRNSKSNDSSKYDSLLEYKTPHHFKSIRFSLIPGSELPERASLENLKSDMTLQRLIEKFFSTLSNEKFWDKSANKQIMDQERVIEGLKNENTKMYDELSTRISQLMLEVEELKNERNQLKYELASAKTSSKSSDGDRKSNEDENDEQTGLSKRASVQSIPVEVTDEMHILNAESSTNSTSDNHFEVIALISPSWAIHFGTTTFDESIQQNKVFANESDSSIIVHYKKEDGTEAERAYQVDRVHGQSDKVVFDLSNEMIDVIDSVLEGKNCSILFCGDSNSGKSLVMNGSVPSKVSSTKASSQPSSPLSTHSSITKGMEGLLVNVVKKLFSCISSALASDGWSTGHQRNHQVILSFQVVGTNNKAIDVLLGYSGPGLISHTPPLSSSTVTSEDENQDNAASEPLLTAVEVNSAIECMNVIEQTNNRMKEQFPSLIGHKLITLTVVLPNEGRSNSSLPLSGEGKLQIVELIGTDKLQVDPGLQSFSTIELDESKNPVWPKSSLAKSMISKTSLTTNLIVVLHPQQPQQAIDTLNFVENIRQLHIA